ncbi:hypothetical protein [Devosia pacifica]|nr:hypothetical protein [Devosia pacifica]
MFESRHSARASHLPHRPKRVIIASTLAVLIALLIAGLFANILVTAASTTGGTLRTDIWHLVRMTSIQAGLTTVLSIAIGIALAWALNRLRFFGRDLVIGVFAAAIVTPGIVVAFGMLSIWGRSGWINSATTYLFGESIGNLAFGLWGIIFAHLILDATFAARILLERLDAIPAARLKIGQSLGLSPWQRFTIIDWPAIRGSVPGLAAVIFLLAFTSFPIVLLLGGGPANQTLEVAIFAAVRQQFDLLGAVHLALVQILVCSLVILAAAARPPVPISTGVSTGQNWHDRGPARLLQWGVLGLGIAGFLLPLLAVIFDGVVADLADVLTRPTFWRAATTSVVIGLSSAALTLILALGLGLGRAASARRTLRLGLGLPVFAYLAVPAVVLSLGFFLSVRNLGIAPAEAAPIVVIIANALLALPFASATLGPPLEGLVQNKAKLIRSLGLNSWQQLRYIELPLLRREVGVVLALAFCFSFGDLGVIALFGTQDFQTLPLMMYRALGSYRSDDAAVIAALLLVATILAFIALPRLFERLLDARS